MDYKLIIGILSIILTIYAYYSYIISIFKNKTKPHIFSWLIWSISTTVVFLGQLIGGGGYGVFGSGAIAFFVILIFFLSLKKGEKSFSKMDIFSLFFALFALLLWYITDNLLYSVLLLVIIDIFGFIPTFLKTYKDPFSEDIQIYLITGIIYLLSFISLGNYSLLTIFGPVVIGGVNFIFVFFTLFLIKNK